jgi:hypothetical protein
MFRALPVPVKEYSNWFCIKYHFLSVAYLDELVKILLCGVNVCVVDTIATQQAEAAYGYIGGVHVNTFHSHSNLYRLTEKKYMLWVSTYLGLHRSG